VGALAWCFLGHLGYAEAREIQEAVAARRRAGAAPDLLLALEHPPVVTVGRGQATARASAGATAGPAKGSPVPWLRVKRGGGPTYHGPGQLVVYPVVALGGGGRGVRSFVCALERGLCDTAARFGVTAVVRDGFPGAWVEPADAGCESGGGSWRKIGSVGIAVARGVTLHGAALNLDRRAEDGFRGFPPCGLADVVATSIGGERGGEGPALEEAATAYAEAFAARFGRDALERVAPDAIGIALPAIRSAGERTRAADRSGGAAAEERGERAWR